MKLDHTTMSKAWGRFRGGREDTMSSRMEAEKRLRKLTEECKLRNCRRGKERTGWSERAGNGGFLKGQRGQFHSIDWGSARGELESLTVTSVTLYVLVQYRDPPWTIPDRARDCVTVIRSSTAANATGCPSRAKSENSNNTLTGDNGTCPMLPSPLRPETWGDSLIRCSPSGCPICVSV